MLCLYVRVCEQEEKSRVEIKLHFSDRSASSSAVSSSLCDPETITLFVSLKHTFSEFLSDTLLPALRSTQRYRSIFVNGDQQDGQRITLRDESGNPILKTEQFRTHTSVYLSVRGEDESGKESKQTLKARHDGYGTTDDSRV
jgi:hypothetical protein